tara:strand:- start:57 stop:170 length:114 start_codon:yes stop_codon:yes gene_type:complete
MSSNSVSYQRKNAKNSLDFSRKDAKPSGIGGKKKKKY